MRLQFKSRAGYRLALTSLSVTAVAGFGLLLFGANAHASGSSISVTDTIPTCTLSSFGKPTQLDLSSAPLGLTIQSDQPTKYHVFGDTADQIRTQIQHCGPRSDSSADAEFTGQTAYTLTWQYDLTQAGDACSIMGVRVGLHTSMALPYWQPTSKAASGLQGRWQRFDNSLQTHENGHVAIDKLYAAKLTVDLEDLGSLPCSDVASVVQDTANSVTAVLNQANDAYDTTTDHGATQGAILPTS